MKTIGLLCMLMIRTQSIRIEEEPWWYNDWPPVGGGPGGPGGPGIGSGSGAGIGGGGIGGGSSGGSFGGGGFSGGSIGGSGGSTGLYVQNPQTQFNGLYHQLLDAARSPYIGKRNIDLASMVKAASFIETHRSFLDDLINIIENVTDVTIGKMEGLLKDFTDSPSEDSLTKIVTYAQAHHLIQERVLQWIEKNVPAVTAIAIKDLLASHKRQATADLILAHVQHAESQVVSSFRHLINKLELFVRGQLHNIFRALLPHRASHPQLRAMVQHGNHRLDTASGAVHAIKAAAVDILQETAKQGPPAVSEMLSDVKSTVQTTLPPQTTTSVSN